VSIVAGHGAVDCIKIICEFT